MAGVGASTSTNDELVDLDGPDLDLSAPRYPDGAPPGGDKGGRRRAGASTPSWRTAERWRRALWGLAADAPLLTAALCAVIAAVGFRGGDYPAQDYRAFMFGAHGFLIWDVNWYGGHALLGYSVLFPAVGWMLGTVPATALACITSTFLFGRLVGRADNWPSVVARLWFAAFVVGDLIVGRAPFACAVTASLAAVLAVRAKRPWLGAAAAVIASLFSPLGAAFLLLVAIAWAPSLGWRRAAPFAGVFVGLAVTFVAGDGGVFPFPWSGFVGQLAIVAIGLTVAPRHERIVRRTLWIYGASCIALFLVPNPVGGNIARLAGIMIGPAAALVLLRAHRLRALLLVAVPLLVFQLLPVIGAVASAAGDPSTKPSYYDGMLSYLTQNQQPLGRVEIPFTRDHWEAKYVAEKVPLARGWDRQIDLSRNAVLYAPLTDATYRTWLLDNAVRFVALPDAPLDQGGQAEKALLRHPPAWLRLVYTDNQWHIWQVVGAAPLASGAATMSALTASTFTLSAASLGITFVRLRWSAYWHIDNGAVACVAPAAGGWTTVLSFAPGPIKISARALPSDSGCTDQELALYGLGDGGAPEPTS
jgi:hypothetical protein